MPYQQPPVIPFFFFSLWTICWMSQFKGTTGNRWLWALWFALCSGSISKRVRVPQVELSSQENRAEQEGRHRGIYPPLPIDLGVFGEKTHSICLAPPPSPGSSWWDTETQQQRGRQVYFQFDFRGNQRGELLCLMENKYKPGSSLNSCQRHGVHKGTVAKHLLRHLYILNCTTPLLFTCPWRSRSLHAAANVPAWTQWLW